MIYTKFISTAGMNLTFFEKVMVYLYFFSLLGGNAVLLISGEGDNRNNGVFVLSWLTIHALGLLVVIRSSALSLLREKIVLIYLLFFLLSTVWSREPSKTLIYSGMLAANIMFAYFVATRLSLTHFLHVVWRVITFMVMAGLIGWILGYDNVRYIDPHLRPNILGMEPIRGFFAHKVMASLYANIGLFLTFVLLSGLKRLFLISMYVFFIAMTGSSTGIVIIFLFLFVYLLYRYVQLRKISIGSFFCWFAVVSLIVGMGAYFYLGEVLLALGRDPTLTGRTLLWDWGVKAWLERFYLGWGFLGYFESNSYFSLQMNYDVFDNYEVPHFHNSYIQTLVDFGVVGAGLLLYCIGLSFSSYYRRGLFDIDGYYADAAQVILIILVLVSSTMHLYFNYNHFATFILFYFFFNSRLVGKDGL
jgi:O-antigen ligase